MIKLLFALLLITACDTTDYEYKLQKEKERSKNFEDMWTKCLDRERAEKSTVGRGDCESFADILESQSFGDSTYRHRWDAGGVLGRCFVWEIGSIDVYEITPENMDKALILVNGKLDLKPVKR